MPVQSWPVFGERLPLWEAVYHQDIAAVQTLLASPEGAAQVNVPHGLWQETSVHVAVRRADAKMLKHLLFAAGDPNARSVNGSTPLHMAVQQRRKDIVESLLLAGANPLLRNFEGTNAIRQAKALGLSSVAIILEHQAVTMRLSKLR